MLSTGRIIPHHPSPPHRAGGGTAEIPSLAVDTQADIDAPLARGFYRVIRALEGDQWGTLRFQDGKRGHYLIPKFGDLIMLAAPNPSIRHEMSQGIEELVRRENIGELYLYDTMLTQELVDLCGSLRDSLDRLVIRDHHGEQWRVASRARIIRNDYGGKAEVSVCSREEAATCFERVEEFRGELAAPSLNNRKKLAIVGPLDIDSLSCLAAGLGLAYPGQLNDVKAIEARDVRAQRQGVSEIGDAILDALRVSPMVLKQQGHKTFATLLLMSAFQVMSAAKDGADWLNAPPGRSLTMLGNLSRAVTENLICALITHFSRPNHVARDRSILNVSLIDLSLKPAQASHAFEAALRAPQGRPVHYEEFGVTIEVPPRQALAELLKDPERLRLSTLEDAATLLAREDRIPRDCFVFVRVPGEKGRTITRFVALGTHRTPEFQAKLPFVDKPGLARGVVKREGDFSDWLQFR